MEDLYGAILAVGFTPRTPKKGSWCKIAVIFKIFNILFYKFNVLFFVLWGKEGIWTYALRN